MEEELEPEERNKRHRKKSKKLDAAVIASSCVPHSTLLSRSDKVMKGKKTQAEVHSAVSDFYEDFKMLYQIFLTLPVTTATPGRVFSKLPLVKSRLRTTITRPRLESLVMATWKRISQHQSRTKTESQNLLQKAEEYFWVEK